MSKKAPCEFQSYSCGACTIHRVEECQMRFPPHGILATSSKEQARDLKAALTSTEWLKPFRDEQGNMVLNIQAYCVLTPGGKKIVVDTCVGNDRERGATKQFNNLQTGLIETMDSLGVPASGVTHVMCTHMHVDHVGWNTYKAADGSWQPTFTNAKYLFNKQEFEHWKTTIEAGGGSDMTNNKGLWTDSIEPIVKANLQELVDTNYVLADEGEGCRVYLISTPGHTPGHCSVAIESHGERAIISGDCIHHPLQLKQTGIGSLPDTDQAAAIQTRRTLLGALAGTRTVLFGTHFAGPSCGCVVRDLSGANEYILDINAPYAKPKM